MQTLSTSAPPPILTAPSTDHRLLLPGDLPQSLWHQHDQLLSLPPILLSVYHSLLDRHRLRALASNQPLDRRPVGGVTKMQTDEHLAWAFPGSSARVELAILDPHNKMPHVADSFIRLLAGDKVAIADVPCGSGAAALSILTTLAELRRQSRIPAQPLDAVVIGGEISQHARSYANEAFTEAIPYLEEQGIFVEQVFLGWDVCDQLSNTDLIKQLTLRSQNCGARLLIVANFSGFLQRDGKFKEATPQLEELFRHARGERSSAIWIEPQTNHAIHKNGGLWGRITKWLSEKWASFVSVHPINGVNEVAQSSCKCQHALDADSRFDVHLSVLRCDLGIGK